MARASAPGGNRQDVAAGVIFAGLGGLFVLGSLQLEIGTPLRMGPGFFPLILGGVLVLLGLLIVLAGARAAPEPLGPIPHRGLPLILAAPVLFALTVRGLGLVPAIVLVTLFSAYASRRMTHPLAALLTAGLTVFCVVVFSYGLGLPIPLIGSWLRGVGGP